MNKLNAPHHHIETHHAKERFLLKLFDTFWVRYRERMESVQKYETLIASNRASFFNDHIAFRTLAAQNPSLGIFALSRIFEALGYTPIECYLFPDKHLSSIYYQHPHFQFPKLFITQLQTWELSKASQEIVERVIQSHRPVLTQNFLNQLYHMDSVSDSDQEKILAELNAYFAHLPWDVPQKNDVIQLDKESQYGAWVLVNGYNVNHFTALVNSHGVENLNDIEKTIQEMKKAGIPMKKEIEGALGSKLRQSSTEAAVLKVSMKEGSSMVLVPWTYAYFEIIERPITKNSVTGKNERFEGFLGAQATNLFEMTKNTK